MDDETRLFLDKIGLLDEVLQHGEYVTVSKAKVIPNDVEPIGKVTAFIRIVLAVSDQPGVKGKIY